jgi:rhamnulokinase
LSFAEIAAAAEATPGFTSTIAPNDPRFLAPACMLEAIAGYCRESGQAVPQTVGDYARCCYASLAKAYREELDKLAAVTGRKFTRLHIVGGGSQAELLNQLTADRCGIPVIAGPTEATAIGNLCLQAQANGQFKDLAAIRQAIAAAFPVKVYQPR